MKIKTLAFLISSFMLTDLSAASETSINFKITNQNIDFARLPDGQGSIYFQNNFGKEPNTFLSPIPKTPGKSLTASQSMTLSTWNNTTFILFVVGDPNLSSNAVNCSGVLPYESFPKQVNVVLFEISPAKGSLTPADLVCEVSFTSAGGN